MEHPFQSAATAVPTTSVNSAQVGTSPTTTSKPSRTNPFRKMTPYIAKVKCKQFLSTLLSLASEHPGVTIKVKMLVQGLIDSILKPEEFTSKIQRVLSNTSPQTGLIRFLKKSLPYLRHSLATKELTIEGIIPPPLSTATVYRPSVVQHLNDVEVVDISEENDESTQIMCLCNEKSNGLICCGQCDNSVLKELNVKSSGGGEQSEQNLSLPPSLAQENKIYQSAKEVELVDITMNSDNEENEKVTVTRDNTEEMSSVCGHRQPNYDGDGSMVSYNQCGNLFHGPCDDTTRTSSSQMNEKGVNILAKQFPASLPPSSSSTSPFNLLKDDFDQEGNSEDTIESPALLNPLTPALSLKEEEVICLSELSNLTQEIQSVQSTILNMMKSFQEEARQMRMARSKSANDLRARMEQFVKKDRRQSVELVVLMELSERYQQQLTDLMTQKIQLELELHNLRQVSAEKRIKLEPFGSDSAAAFEESGERIRQKKHLLFDVKQKIAVILKEDALLSVRIRGKEKHKTKNNVNLKQMQNDLESLEREPANGSPPVSACLELEAIKRDQTVRIKNFVNLERKLAQINFGYVLNDIHHKKEEWLNALNAYNNRNIE